MRVSVEKELKRTIRLFQVSNLNTVRLFKQMTPKKKEVYAISVDRTQDLQINCD